MQGPKGDSGPSGTALGYAYIKPDGAFDPNRSKNVFGSSRGNTGAYCLLFSVTPHVAVATVDTLGGGEVSTFLGPAPCSFILNGSRVDGNVQVNTANSSGTAVDDFFDVIVD